MSVESFAVNDTKKQLVDLGRICLHEDDVVDASPLELAQYIRDAAPKLSEKEVARLAALLETMCVERIIYDTFNDFSEVEGYLFVGTVYTVAIPHSPGTFYTEPDAPQGKTLKRGKNGHT